MDFNWTEEQQQLRSVVEEFSKKELNEGLVERDQLGEFNHRAWLSCAKMGIQGLNVPEKYGGLERDPLTTVGVLERLGYGCQDNGLCFSIGAHMWTAQTPLMHFGTDQQKNRYLPGLVTGELIGGNAMTEPEAGSDAYSLKTTATRHADKYLLNGSKVFITNAPIADLLVVFATVDAKKGKDGITAFLVDTKSTGFNLTRKLEKMGLNTSPMGEIHFDNCEVPASNLLGKEGSGQALFTDAMTWERSCILASAVGAMERLLERSIDYAKNRKQFGVPIINHQLTGSKLVDMKLKVESSRSALYQAAWKKSAGRNIFLEAALAKLSISENWVSVAQEALQIHGGYGYMKEFGIERELRDAVGSKIYSGTSEIQRLIASNLIGI